MPESSECCKYTSCKLQQVNHKGPVHLSFTENRKKKSSVAQLCDPAGQPVGP